MSPCKVCGAAEHRSLSPQSIERIRRTPARRPTVGDGYRTDWICVACLTWAARSVGERRAGHPRAALADRGREVVGLTRGIP